MVEVTITVKDEAGNPMKNIAYHLEYLSGEKGSYQPGYGITDSSGKFTRKAHPNAKYILYLQKVNAVSYTQEIKASVYEEMIVNLNITETYETEIVWNEDDVVIVKEMENPATINITDIYDGNYEEVFLQLFTRTGGQVQLGYADDAGKYVWNDSVDGEYYLSLQVFDKTSEYDSIAYSQMFQIEIADRKVDIIGEVAEDGMNFPE